MINLMAISNALPPLTWIVISSILFAGGDILFRFWNQYSSTMFFVMAMVVVIVGVFSLAMSFPHQNIAVATVVSVLFNITIYLVAAFLIFGDTISIKEAIGILIGFLAIYVLEGMK